MARRRRPDHDAEEPESHERWLVTYADMITLLMVLFIVLFAMGQVDTAKYNALKAGLAAGFGQQESVLQGASSLLEEPGTTSQSQVAASIVDDPVGSSLEQVRTRVSAGDSPTPTAAAAQAELDRLHRIEREVAQALREEGLQGDVNASYDERGLVLSMASRHVVFPADLASLSPRGARVVDTIGKVLADLPDEVEVAGNTNQVHVRPAYFPTDWDLSAARAVTVLRRLNEKAGIVGRRLSLTAFGDTRPLRDPSLPGSQAVNKRVDIVILSGADAGTRELMTQLPGARATVAGRKAQP